MVVNFIKCPNCREMLNSFYVSMGVCPSCKKSFYFGAVSDSGTGLKDIKEQRRIYKQKTMSKYQIIKMFNLSDKEISKIPCSNKYGQERYKKTDVVKFI